MSHSFRKTRTKDKRDRHARGGRPPDGNITPAPGLVAFKRDLKRTAKLFSDRGMRLNTTPTWELSGYACDRCRGAGCSACTDDDGLPL